MLSNLKYRCHVIPHVLIEISLKSSNGMTVLTCCRHSYNGRHSPYAGGQSAVDQIFGRKTPTRK